MRLCCECTALWTAAHSSLLLLAVVCRCPALSCPASSGSLYTTDSGDWKLFGFDLTHKGTESLPDQILLGRNSGILPVQYRAPELIKNASSAAAPAVLHATDAWSLGCTIFHIFNANFSSPQQLAQTGNVPETLLADYKKLLATNPANRLNPRALLESPFFRNDLVSCVDFLDNLALKSAQEKEAFFVHFAAHVNEFPHTFCKFKLLPLLTKSLDYGSGLTCFSAILQSVLKIGSKLNESEFASLVLPSVLRLFGSNERAIRVHLLQHLGDYAPSLTETLVNESIFPHVQTGFTDSNAILRELTVKSLLHLAPKLNSTNMDQALRMLAKMQGDAEPAIRTNTCYCIAKIAGSLGPAMQEKVLCPAFAKCLRDPFPPARVAGLMSFLATLELHKPADVARKILPAVTPSLADDVKEVREAALKLIEASVVRMHAYHAQLQQQQAAMLAANPNAMGSHQLAGGAQAATSAPQDAAHAISGAAGAVLGSLGSWAVSTVRSKMSNADSNPPPRAMQQQSQPQSHQTATAASNLNPASQGGRGYGNSTTTSVSSTSVLAAATASPTSTGAGANFDNDDFFSDFGAGSSAGGAGGDGGDSDSDAPTPVLSLSTKTKVAKAGRKPSDAKKESTRKSILASVSPPPAAAGSASASASLDDWNFDGMDSSSKGAAASNSIVDDFDDWGSSVAAKPATAAAASSKASMHAKKASDATDLLSFSPAPPAAAAHKKSPSAASDPFANLSLSSASSVSPKPPLGVVSPGSGGGSLSLKARPAQATPLVLSAKSAATTGAAKKPASKVDDDWGSFLNS